jgi:hypothetical protein
VTVLAGVIATLSAGLFAGAALYITVVEQPVRLRDTMGIALTEWRARYPRAAVMQATLAVVGALAGLTQWWLSANSWWAVGGLLFGSVVPYTLLVVIPTNRRLSDPRLAATSPEARVLLARWGQLHAVRTGVSVVAFLIFSVLLAGDRG